MRIVFMGTPEFSVPILRRLAEEHEVVTVYTRPDAVSGRGKALVAPPVKTAAEHLGIPVFQPASLRSAEVVDALRADAPDVIVVAAYGLLLPPEVLAVPEHGCVNVHASLLPRYRGAAPVHRAILAGDRVTGVSIMLMEEGLDTGPFALQRSVEIEDLNAVDLTGCLAELGAQALIEVLRHIEDGTVSWTSQNDADATYAAKITKDDIALDPALSMADALRRVRSSSRQAPVRIHIEGVDLTLLRAVAAEAAIPAGVACRVSDGLLLGFSDGAVLVDRIQPAGKTAVDGSAWARGSRLSDEASWRRA